LYIEWGIIPERKDETIFAGLIPEEKTIVLNENRRPIYRKIEGLYNSVLGHELGHYALHTKYGLQRNNAPNKTDPQFLHRSKGPNTIVEWQAHLFMGYLLMPNKLLRIYTETEDIYKWTTLYELKEKFHVTISGLVHRLQNLHLIYIDQNQKICLPRAR
jgi:Zn-dependent peptidase ImmA (M78 family)